MIMLGTFIFAMLCGVWRAWLGGVFETGEARLTWLKYLTGIGGIAGALYALTGNPWYAAGHALAFLALWRALGHGPMLRVPLGDRADGSDLILNLLDGPNGTVLQWFAYAAVRYALPLMIWAEVARWTGNHLWPLMIAAPAIPLWYYLQWQLKAALPGCIYNPAYPNGIQPCHYAEFLSGATVGAALILMTA